MIDIFGWWAFDPDTIALINKVTGERVRFVARMTGEFAPAEGEWLQFQYEHDGLSYPVLVEVAEIEYFYNSHTRNTKRGLGWQLDHIRSAELWKKEQPSHNSNPGYGVWRRVDDCLTDALRFWPDATSAGRLPDRFLVSGGWLNGAWSALWERVYLPSPDNFKGVFAEFNAENLQKKWLFPLNEESHSEWIFHNDIGEKPDVGKYDEAIHSSFWLNSLYIKGRQKIPLRDKNGDLVPEEHDFIFSSHTRITGIHGQTVYMESTDKTSVLALRRCATEFDCERGSRNLDFFYADYDITTTIHATNHQLKSPSDWSAQNPQFYKARHPNWPANYWSEPEEGKRPGITPALEMWRRTDPKIRDAFLHWQGTELRHDDWLSDYGLPEVSWLAVKGNFLAGMWSKGSSYYARRTEQPTLLSKNNYVIVFI